MRWSTRPSLIPVMAAAILTRGPVRIPPGRGVAPRGPRCDRPASPLQPVAGGVGAVLAAAPLAAVGRKGGGHAGKPSAQVRPGLLSLPAQPAGERPAQPRL